MKRLDVVQPGSTSPRRGDYYHHNLKDRNVYNCTLYFTDELDSFIKRYIPTGIILFNECKVANVEKAITDIFDKMDRDCGDQVFDDTKAKQPTLVNARYAFSVLKNWCSNYGNSLIKVQELKTNVDD